MALSKDIVAAVKDRADIVEVIGERVHLQAAGADFVGLCPFHGEKTPSFRVSPSWRTYHCFGCGVGGSVIDFVMAQERMAFPEALRALAERFGVPLPDEPGGREGADRSREVLVAAEAYYRDLLQRRPEGERARNYLRERDFHEPDWETFGLGWALDQWQGFMSHGLSQGFSHEDLLASGLVRQREPGGRMFDMLRKRVAIPIRDERGRPIAFGGRVIDPLDDPKYLNTPETRHYHKSRVLFGLAQGLEAMRRSRRALLVEGYLDVMRLHRHGFTEAVATCGTALTEEHLKLLSRYADKALLVFDGDEAGIKAALRSAPLFLNAGLEARVVLIPEGQDPDDFLRRHPPEAFGALLEDATALLEFLVFQLARRHGRSLQGREQTLEALVPVLGQVRKPAARDLTVRFVADLVGVSPEAVLSLLRPARGGEKQGTGYSEVALSEDSRLQRRLPRAFLNLMILIRRWGPLISLDRFTDVPSRKVVERMLQTNDTDLPGLDLDGFRSANPDLDSEIRQVLFTVSNYLKFKVELEREIEHVMIEIENRYRIQFFREKLRQTRNHPQHWEWLGRYASLGRQFKKLRDSFRSTFAPRADLRLKKSVEWNLGDVDSRIEWLKALSRSLDELRYDVANGLASTPTNDPNVGDINMEELQAIVNRYDIPFGKSAIEERGALPS